MVGLVGNSGIRTCGKKCVCSCEKFKSSVYVEDQLPAIIFLDFYFSNKMNRLPLFAKVTVGTIVCLYIGSALANYQNEQFEKTYSRELSTNPTLEEIVKSIQKS
jgi:hypothetical protein